MEEKKMNISHFVNTHFEGKQRVTVVVRMALHDLPEQEEENTKKES
ncbi:hypothetical protein [Brevibacillus antibioticus]|nr:hypothetical protein [Brevibacillus antibioticus]